MTFAEDMASAVADLRAVAEEFMMDSCGISTRTTVVTNGVSKPSYGTPVNTLCQWLSDEGGTEYVDGVLKTITESKATVLFPSITVISAESMIVFKDRKWNITTFTPSDELMPYISVRVKELK